jgi:hypothetical protein
MRPDVLIIGDSHTAALKAGCDAVGLRAELLYVSGNHWHAGAAEYDAVTGLQFPRRPMLQRRVNTICRTLGTTSLFTPAVPVIASVGYHLGRLTPPFAGWGHTTDAGTFADDPEAQFASSGLVGAYVRHYREAHLTMLAQVAALCDLTVVAPPMVQPDGTTHAFACHITQRLQQAGVQVQDPRAGKPFTGAKLADALLSADGVHGNAVYGERVIRSLLRKGLIRKPEARVTLVA